MLRARGRAAPALAGFAQHTLRALRAGLPLRSRRATRQRPGAARRGARVPFSRAGCDPGAAPGQLLDGVRRRLATAHQIHGAIGFTREQDLRLFTQRLLAWRSELGSDHSWAERLGRAVTARGADSFWPELTARGDPPRPALAGRSR
jgi:hypothetical protein